MQRLAFAPVFIVYALMEASVACAQFRPGDWTTAGFDAQRSFWLRNDAKISLDSMRKPGFELVWKINLNETGRGQNLPTPPVLLDFYIGYRGFRSLGFVGMSSNTAIGIDTDLGRIEWKRDFNAGGAGKPGDSALCPGGMTSGVTRPVGIGYPPLTAGVGRGRGSPAKSGVGEPFEGAVTLKQAAARPSLPPPAPKPSGTATRRVSTPASPFASRVQLVHALTSDGKFHSVYVSNGDEPKAAVPFLPPNAYAKGLMVAENGAYVATANGCGGVENGVWALDLESRKVSHWKSGGSVAGSLGPALGPDGTVYAAAGGELVALEERTLKVKSSYQIGRQSFTSSPVVFDFKGKDLIAATSNDGRLHLLDAAAPSKPLVTTPAFSSLDFETGALASWQDPAGTRWVLAPAGGAGAAGAGFTAANGDVKNGAIVAWKVVEQNGAPALQPGWISRDMTSPLTPIVVNGVIFAVSSGEHRTRDAKVTFAQRAQRSSPAVLYALDSASGKELWNSGNTIGSFVTSGGLAAGGSQVYVATQDGTQYVFGFPIEH